MGRHMQTDDSDPTETTVTNNTNRTPSTTRDTWVTLTVDYNTLAAATTRTGTLTIGALAATAPIILRNFDAVVAFRITCNVAFLCPRGKAYNLNMDNATNLTIRAVEKLM